MRLSFGSRAQLAVGGLLSLTLLFSACNSVDGSLLRRDAGPDERGRDASGLMGEQRDAGVGQAGATSSSSDTPQAEASVAPDVTDDDTGEAAPQGDVTVCGNGMVDPEERCDVAIVAGEDGACPTACIGSSGCMLETLAGGRCSAECVQVEILEANEGDGCCPSGQNANTDGDCEAQCGNGAVEGEERCDPVDSCVTAAECVSTDACLAPRYRGDASACTAECSFDAIDTCSGGDGCCPDGCDAGTDSDCSSTCGDGVIDDGSGETCEPGSATPCPASCSDGDTCTEDVRTGSEANCNVRCTYNAIAQAIGGDGCCLPGNNANDDTDCTPECGNGAVEPGEECDGQADCDGDCNRISPNTQICEDTLGDTPCDVCQCESCADEIVNCRASGDATSDMHCGAVVDCGLANACTGIDCYCGAISLLDCGLSGPQGDCIPEIEAAAGTTDPIAIAGMVENTDNPVGRAFAVGQCGGAACVSECNL
ncbi:MAG: hypothetical protein OXT09_22325 [Myxococcales bacterium]|nr:hypothetical protein [Myxococcales bacterium]